MQSTELPDRPTNIIFTGVAGTGKTHRLLEIQKCYDDVIESSWEQWRIDQIAHYSWRDVICAVLFIEDRMMTVAEMVRHPITKDKASANKREDNINQTLWLQLNRHAHPDSTTVNSSQRSANYYFDKSDTGQWYLLDQVKPSIEHTLNDLIATYTTPNQQQSHQVSRSCLVSFHQAYGYDEFVEGIRPHIHPQTGQMQYDVQNGAFLALCERARNDPSHRYAMLIDEINRANTAQVFGELMSVIEPSKRTQAPTPMSVRLAYSGRKFSVPSNVDIYATMNTQDHSLASLDMAFRRRFEFVTCDPDSSIVAPVIDDDNQAVDLAAMMESINYRIKAMLGEEAQLGHSYFMGIDSIAELARRLHKQVIPQLVHHLKLMMAGSTYYHGLFQLLYGYDINAVSGQLDDKEQWSEYLIQPIIKESQRTQDIQFQIAPAFIKVTRHSTPNIGSSNATMSQRSDKTENSDNIKSLFLTAKPYQLLYKM